MSSLAEDQAHLLRALARFGVEFVVVGGVAAQLHGWEGATTDLDIAVSDADILRSKEAAGRDKDREALPGIRRSFESAGLLG